MSEQEEAKPDLTNEEWEAYDPRDGSCSGCYWGGCTEDHPIGACCVSGPEWDEHCEGRLQNLGHARLIAAAPDLLAAGVAMLAAHDGDIEELVAAHDAMKAAIAKARGGHR